ncbi:MAG: TetR family transcriptional regulator [Pseudomonadota bacterium]
MPAGRPRQFNPDDVLDCAVEIIWRDGPFAHSLNELAALLGLTKPALARMFGGKDDFLAAVLKRYFDKVCIPLEGALDTADTVQSVAEIYLGYYSDALSQKPVGPFTGCLLAASTDATAVQNGLVPETTRDLNSRTRNHLADVLKAVGADAPEELATYLYGQGIALAFLSRSGAGPDALRRFRKRALAGVGV